MYKEAFELMKISKKIYIVSHIRPDGDAIGSVLSMYLALKGLGKDVSYIMPTYMKKYGFLKELQFADKEVKEAEYDLLICMDASQEERLAMDVKDFKKANKIIVFDHHMMNTIKADIEFVDEKSPSNCEIVYNFFVENNIVITKEMANHLYLGIMTDTGSFNYKRTTAKSYLIASKLIEIGADFFDICRRINDTYSEKKLKLLGFIITNMESYFDGKVMFSKIIKEEMDAVSADDEDTEGLVNYLRMIEGTEIVILAYPMSDNSYKISMRTQGKLDGSKIARVFGGGGHIRASGFDTYEVEKIKKELLEEIGKELKIEDSRNT